MVFDEEAHFLVFDEEAHLLVSVEEAQLLVEVFDEENDDKVEEEILEFILDLDVDLNDVFILALPLLSALLDSLPLSSSPYFDSPSTRLLLFSVSLDVSSLLPSSLRLLSLPFLPSPLSCILIIVSVFVLVLTAKLLGKSSFAIKLVDLLRALVVSIPLESSLESFPDDSVDDSESLISEQVSDSFVFKLKARPFDLESKLPFDSISDLPPISVECSIAASASTAKLGLSTTPDPTLLILSTPRLDLEFGR